MLLNISNNIFSFDTIAYPFGWDGNKNQIYINQLSKTFESYLTSGMEMYKLETSYFNNSDFDNGYIFINEYLNIFIFDSNSLMLSENGLFIDIYAFIPLLIILPDEYHFETSNIDLKYDYRKIEINILCDQNSKVYSPQKMTFFELNNERRILNDFFTGSTMGSINNVNFTSEDDEIYTTSFIGYSKEKNISIVLNMENDERRILPIFLQTNK